MLRIIIIASLLVVAPAHAAWNGKSELGYVMARGNADTETANAKFELTQELDRWKHNFAVGGLYGKSNDVISAQRWDTRWQSNYQFNDRHFWFGSTRFEQDHYSGFTFQGSATIGLGHEFIDSGATILTAQLGLGYRSLQPEQLIRDESGAVVTRIEEERQGDAITSGNVKFEHAFNEATKILNSLRAESGGSNSLVQNDIALQVSMTEVLALSVGLSARHNSNPPEGLKKTETLSTINLVYEVK